MYSLLLAVLLAHLLKEFDRCFNLRACFWQVILAKSEETELAEAVRYAFLVSHFIEERIAFLKKWPYLSEISRQEVCSGYIR